MSGGKSLIQATLLPQSESNAIASTHVEATAILTELWRFCLGSHRALASLRAIFNFKRLEATAVLNPIRSRARICMPFTNTGTTLRRLAALLLAFVSFGAFAQDSGKFNIGMAIGFDSIQNAGRNLDMGWNGGIRGGVNIGKHADLDLDASYSQFGLTSAALAFFGETRGTLGFWSLTFQPQWHLAHRRSHVNAYGTGGLGIFHRKLSLGRPVLTAGILCDPFFGCYPVTQTGEQDIDSFTTLKPGFNIGSGLEFRLGESRAKIFAEARYQRMFTNHGRDFSYVPVMVGLSW